VPFNQELIEFAKILGQQTDFEEILRLVANKTTQFLNADLALILMVNPDTRETVKTIFKDGKLTEPQEYQLIHIHVGGWILVHKQPFSSQNIQNDSRFMKGLFQDSPVGAVMGVPLTVEGVTIGALLALYKQPHKSVEPKTILDLENIAAVAVPFLRNVQKIKQFFAAPLPKDALIAKYEKIGLIGKSKIFRELLNAVEAAARCDVRVLLEGNTGTGKELIARAIHTFSSRSNGPFVAIDSGAIPPHLIESELFGHKKGAFTGASAERTGLFVAANGGTLFIDEIENLPLAMQTKFMRVLQHGEIRPLGSNATVKINVRIITASSKPLRTLVDSGDFREDLYFRLHVYPIHVPDLTERGEDMTLLAKHFLTFFSKQQGKKTTSFSEELLDFIKYRKWAGNIRELENFVERLVTVSPPDTLLIDAYCFPPDLQKELEKFRSMKQQSWRGPSLSEQLQNLESNIIKQTLIECDWNQSEAARRLQTSEKNIRYKMKKLHIKKTVAD
jgi:transcriptional regulator with GAF, ATPase, and Fis domain